MRRQKLAQSLVSPPPLGGAGAPWAPFSAWSPLPRRSVMGAAHWAASPEPAGESAPVGGGEGSGKPPSWCVTVREKRFAVSLAFSHALRAYKGKVVGRCPTPRNPLKRVDLNFTWLPAGLYHSSSFPPHLQGPGGI